MSTAAERWAGRLRGKKSACGAVSPFELLGQDRRAAPSRCSAAAPIPAWHCMAAARRECCAAHPHALSFGSVVKILAEAIEMSIGDPMTQSRDRAWAESKGQARSLHRMRSILGPLAAVSQQFHRAVAEIVHGGAEAVVPAERLIEIKSNVRALDLKHLRPVFLQEARGRLNYFKLGDLDDVDDLGSYRDMLDILSGKDIEDGEGFRYIGPFESHDEFLDTVDIAYRKVRGDMQRSQHRCRRYLT